MIETVARRYAGALADVVIKTGEILPVKAELKVWEEMMASSPDLMGAFRNPSIAQASKVKVLESLIEKTKPGKTTANFLRVLLKNSRLTQIIKINERFGEILEERSGLTSGNVTSVRELSDAEKADLQSSLLKLTGKQVKLNYSIDENIIGGVITRIGSTIYDGSVRTQLEELKYKLVNG